MSDQAGQRSRWNIVLLLMGFAALGHFNRVGISVVGSEVFIPKLGISETSMGWVYTTFLITYTIGMLPGGWLIDRIGSARTLALYAMAMGTFVVLTGGLGWIVSTPASLLIGLFVIRGLAGISNTPLHPGAARVVSESFAPANRATANGIVTAGALIGIALCYPVMGWLMDQLTWPTAFAISGGTFIIYGIIWSQFYHRIGLVPFHSKDRLSDEKSHSPMPHEKMFRNRDLWLITVSYAAYGYFQYLFFYWMGYYLETVLHVPKLEARWISFWIMIAQAVGMGVGGICADMVCKRLGLANGRRVMVIIGMGLGGLFGLLAVNASNANQVAIYLALAMGALGLCEGVFWTTTTEIGHRSPGFAAAFMNTGGNVGGLISPVLTPVMAKMVGWNGAIVVACLVAAFGGAIWFLIQLPRNPQAS